MAVTSRCFPETPFLNGPSGGQIRFEARAIVGAHMQRFLCDSSPICAMRLGRWMCCGRARARRPTSTPTCSRWSRSVWRGAFAAPRALIGGPSGADPALICGRSGVNFAGRSGGSWDGVGVDVAGAPCKCMCESRRARARTLQLAPRAPGERCASARRARARARVPRASLALARARRAARQRRRPWARRTAHDQSPCAP